MIKNRIFARNCKIVKISDNKIVSEFLNENHCLDLVWLLFVVLRSLNYSEISFDFFVTTFFVYSSSTLLGRSEESLGFTLGIAGF